MTPSSFHGVTAMTEQKLLPCQFCNTEPHQYASVKGVSDAVTCTTANCPYDQVVCGANEWNTRAAQPVGGGLPEPVGYFYEGDHMGDQFNKVCLRSYYRKSHAAEHEYIQPRGLVFLDEVTPLVARLQGEIEQWRQGDIRAMTDIENLMKERDALKVELDAAEGVIADLQAKDQTNDYYEENERLKAEVAAQQKLLREECGHKLKAQSELTKAQELLHSLQSEFPSFSERWNQIDMALPHQYKPDHPIIQVLRNSGELIAAKATCAQQATMIDALKAEVERFKKANGELSTECVKRRNANYEMQSELTKAREALDLFRDHYDGETGGRIAEVLANQFAPTAKGEGDE